MLSEINTKLTKLINTKIVTQVTTAAFTYACENKLFSIFYFL